MQQNPATITINCKPLQFEQGELNRRIPGFGNRKPAWPENQLTSNPLLGRRISCRPLQAALAFRRRFPKAARNMVDEMPERYDVQSSTIPKQCKHFYTKLSGPVERPPKYSLNSLVFNR
nr:hypothetical protein Iba_chr03cCG7680 [Ipomoea batatas]